MINKIIPGKINIISNLLKTLSINLINNLPWKIIIAIIVVIKIFIINANRNLIIFMYNRYYLRLLNNKKIIICKSSNKKIAKIKKISNNNHKNSKIYLPNPLLSKHQLFLVPHPNHFKAKNSFPSINHP